MSFPDLQLIPASANNQLPSVYHAEAQGVPDNGNNTFKHNINPNILRDHEDQLEFHIYFKGPSVTEAEFVSLSADLTEVTFNFTQNGNSEALVRAIFIQSGGF